MGGNYVKRNTENRKNSGGTAGSCYNGKVSGDDGRIRKTFVMYSGGYAKGYGTICTQADVTTRLWKACGDSRGANPHPCILQDREGNKLLPVFTSEEEMKKGKQPMRFPLILNMPYQACVNMMAKSQEIRAIVVNPYSHNVVINFKKEEKPEKKLTEPQFHALVRQHIESALLPRKIFEEKETFIKELSKRREECLLELYQPPYEKMKNCPYTLEQFELMTLQISETMQLMQIILPTVHLYPGTCPRVFITWNPETQDAAYYAVVRRKQNEQNQLFQVMADGTKKDLGEAPSEGLELQSIINLQNRE